MDFCNTRTSTTEAVSRRSLENWAREQDSASQTNNAGTTTFSIPSTGSFASYKDYLSSIVEKWPEYKDLHSRFHSPNSGASYPCVLVLTEKDRTLESRMFSPWGPHFKSRLKACSEDVKTRVVVAFGRNIGVLDDIGLIYNVDPAFFFAAPIWDWDNTAETQIPISDSPKIFQLRGKMAAQVLRYRNAAGQKLSFGKSEAFFVRPRG